MRNIALAFLLIVAAGCATYDNFTTLFNTYYNATRLMMEVEDEFAFQRGKDNKDKPRVIVAETHTLQEESIIARPKPEFLDEFTIPANYLQPVKTKVDSILIKGSKILANHPKSSYVDGSIFLMAKSHFYKSEWMPSQIKCQELIDLAPNSDFSPATHLILAKNYFMQEKYEFGEVTLSRTVDIAWGQRNYDVLSEAFRLQAELALYNDDIDEALKPYRRAVAQSDDGEMRARWQFEIAAILFRKNEFEAALNEFARVFDHSPDVMVEFEAILYQAACLARLGRYDEAAEHFAELQRNANFEEWMGWTWAEMMNMERQRLHDIADTIATYESNDQLERSTLERLPGLRVALREKEEMLTGMERHADTAYIGNGAVAAYYYQRGLDRFLAGEYREARQHFAQAKVVRSPVHRDAGRYFDLLNSWEEKTSFALPIMGRIKETGTGTDSLRSEVAQKLFEAGRVHEQLGNRDSALKYFEYAADLCPKPNEERARYLFANARLIEYTDYDKFEELYEEIFDLYPLTDFGEVARVKLAYTEAAVKDTVKERYVNGLTQIGSANYGMAVRSFARLAEFNPGSELAPRSLYMAGWVWERHIKNNDSAFVQYKNLVDRYPDSEYARDVFPSVIYAMAVRDGMDLDSLESSLFPKRNSSTEKGDTPNDKIIPPPPNRKGGQQVPQSRIKVDPNQFLQPSFNLPQKALGSDSTKTNPSFESLLEDPLKDVIKSVIPQSKDSEKDSEVKSKKDADKKSSKDEKPPSQEVKKVEDSKDDQSKKSDAEKEDKPVVPKKEGQKADSSSSGQPKGK